MTGKVLGVPASQPASARAMAFTAGAAGILLLLFSYYARTWQSFATVVAICPRQFCDFVDYYYPMGEAVFRTGLPVEGFLYSPFIAIVMAIFPLLGLSASLVVWGVLQVLFVSIYVLLIRRLVPVALPVQLLFVALILFSYPLLFNLMAGQVSVFMMVPILGMLVLYERGHRSAAAVLLAFAASFKFYPIMFVAPFAARRDARFLLFAAAACGVVLLAVHGLLLGGGDSLDFYRALFDSFRHSGWVVTNPHSQFLPHVVLRYADATGHGASSELPLLHGITLVVAAANMGLVYLVQRARLHHADLWSFHLVFLTIPFVLKTSWPHDFAYLPFTQAALAWWLLDSDSPRPEPAPQARRAVTVLLVVSIVFSNFFFFTLFGFVAYGFLALLFWSNLLLLIASHLALLPPAMRAIRAERTGYRGHDMRNPAASQGLW